VSGPLAPEREVTQQLQPQLQTSKRKKTNMKTEHSGRIETLKNAIVAAINATGLKGAGEASSTALKTVRKAFTKFIHGVMVVAKEPEPAWLSNN